MPRKAESRKKSTKVGKSYKINPEHRTRVMGFLGPTKEEYAEEMEGIVFDEPVEYALGVHFDPNTRRRRLPLRQKLSAEQKHIHSVGRVLVGKRKVKPVKSAKKKGKK